MDLLERVISCHFLFIKMIIPQIHAENFTKIVFLWLFCIFIGRGRSVNSSQSTISWKPLEPLLFNEDVILKCFIKDCCPEDTQWTGGKTSSLLTLGRVSNNKAKYEETWGVDASYLKIKNFGIDDGDSLYTCFHGFSKYPKNLTINGNNFALMPTEESLKKNVTVRNGYLNASVEFLKVYPVPVCNCTFQKLGITEDINVSSSFYPTASIFLNGKLDISHQICNKDCFGTIQVDCRIGTHEFKVFDAIVDIQFIQSLHKTKDKEISTTSIKCVVFSVVAVTMLLVAIAIVYVCRRNLKKVCSRFIKDSSLEMCCSVEVNQTSDDSIPCDQPENAECSRSIKNSSIEMCSVEENRTSDSLPCDPSENAGNNGDVKIYSEANSLLDENHKTAGDFP